MQITSQQYPEHRMRLPQDSRSAKRLFWRTADFLFGSIAGWIFVSGYVLLSDRQSVAKLRRRRFSLTRQSLAHARMAGCFISNALKSFFKYIEVFPETQKLYIFPENVERM
jgi:hypothetical protein